MPPKLPTHPRSWGDTSPLPFPAQSLHNIYNTTDTTFLIKQKEDKLPHDASVFVGSLPSNIEQMDLTRMLMEHLSEHTQIKNIKVVRDSKGGVCAFVQCENAASATALIQTLHSSVPKPFLGRILRYEPARAFRTLLVSYRTPTQMTRRGNVIDKPALTAEIELELPDAMRIWKQRHSRFHSILYNSEAIEAQQSSGLDGSSVADNAVFLRPLAFDAEMLKTVASYFGRLESFIPLETLKNDRDDGDQTSDDDNSLVEHALYPAPHNAPRSPGMDNTCWEIKWDHRDDCVSALMTLRRVPHLTVTWAHQPVSSDHSNHSNHQALGFASYPLHVQDCSISAHQSPASPTNMSGDDNNIKINVVHQPTHRHTEYNAFQGRVSGFIQDLNTSNSSHEAPNPPTICPDVGCPSLIGCDMTHRTNQTLNTPGHLSEINRADSDSDEEQELCMPQSPALDTSSITPITSGSQFPVTPTSCDVSLHQTMRPKTLGEKGNPMMNRSDRELDPTTLFVGGLEMFGPGAWDEEKVKNFFARFGGLESVKVVRPLNSCAAFAFVKFNNAESPARAVFEEHNRVYEGRAMRVQLRDCNPPRSPWKHLRGRGRPQQTHVGIQRRLDYKSPYDGQVQNIRTASFKGPKTDDGDEIQLSSLVPPRTQKHSNVDMAIPSSTIPTSPLDLASNANTASQTENYREWYDELESPAHTPTPSSLGSSISTTGPSFPPYPYPLPNRQFYPSPWMHPFMQQPPYHVPYYGSYPIYPGAAQNPTQSLTSHPGADTSGPPVVPHWPQMSMYGSYIPYPVLPPRTHDTDPGQAQHLNAQAPLVPTGFIQNEQGTLVAVYHPEALDQYLARTQGTPAPTTTSPTNISMQRWIPYTARPYEPDGSMATFPRTAQAGQMRSLPSFPVVRPPQFSDFQRSYLPFRPGDGTPNSLSRRHGGRREPQLPFTPGRSNPRLFGGRTFRPVPPMQNPGQVYPPEMRQQSSSVPMPADWNKWDAGR